MTKRSFGTLLRQSVILSFALRLTEVIYGALKNGLFGTVFTSYPTDSDTGTRAPLAALTVPLRRFLSRTVEESCTSHLLRTLIRFLMRCRLRVYGTFCLTFGIYAALSYLLAALGDRTTRTSTLAVALVLIGASLPLLGGRGSLAAALGESSLAAPLLNFLGIRREALRVTGESGRSNIAFVLGMLLGVCTFFVPAIFVVILPLGIFLAYRILITPEVGVALLFLTMPILPTMVLVALVLYTGLACVLKLLLGKRPFHPEKIDTAVAAFGAVMLMGGFLSFSSGSRKPSLVFVCFLGAYLLTVLLIRTYEWMTRCIRCALLAASGVALYGILQYFTGSIGEEGAWLDAAMFEDISGRVVSTLENPNMLAEYLILLFPLALAGLIGQGSTPKRLGSLFACGAVGACIILTWSRGAWLGLIFGMLVFFLIWNRRTLYLILAGVLSVPILPFVLPDSIVSRFASIGNLADTSTSYRVNIWRGTVRMLEDYWSCGIGIGEAAWDTVYPRYALAAIETAPHSHNLYLQIWVENGLPGLLLFLFILFLLMQYAFTYFRDLSTAGGSFSLSAPLREDSGKIHRVTLRREVSPRMREREITTVRLETAAPLCGILATLIQGFTDYTWYNYRVYLMFWLMAGLTAAAVRIGRAELSRCRGQGDEMPDTPTEADVSLPLIPKKPLPQTQKGSTSHG